MSSPTQKVTVLLRGKSEPLKFEALFEEGAVRVDQGVVLIREATATTTIPLDLVERIRTTE